MPVRYPTAAENSEAAVAAEASDTPGGDVPEEPATMDAAERSEEDAAPAVEAAGSPDDQTPAASVESSAGNTAETEAEQPSAD